MSVIIGDLPKLHCAPISDLAMHQPPFPKGIIHMTDGA